MAYSRAARCLDFRSAARRLGPLPRPTNPPTVFLLCAVSLCALSCKTSPATGPQGPSGLDYPLFSPAAYFNRPISYWGLGVDGTATTVMRDFLVTDSRCTATHPGVSLGGYSIYFVHDGDSNLREYSIVRRLPSDTLFTCSIPGRDPITTFRIPRNAIWSYPSATGNHDHHLFVIDVSRNVVLSFYSYDDANMGEMPVDSSNFMSEYVNCDAVHGEAAVLLGAETSRWKAGPDWRLPEENGGVGGIGMGFGWPAGVTNGGDSVGGALLPQDFVVPGRDDLGHVMNCNIPADLQNGKSWPATGSDGPSSSPPASVIRSGTLLRLDPTWPIPGETPEWEARILRTFQRYGCMIDDNGAPNDCLGMRGEGTWNGPGGSNLWVGALPSEILGSSHAEIGLSLSHFPADRIQVMAPLGPVYDVSAQRVDLPSSAPPFILSHQGLLAVDPGQTAWRTITTTLVSGSAAPVSFSVSGIPTGIDYSFEPAVCTPTESVACSTALTFTASGAAAPGTYEVTVTGSMSQSQTMTTSLSLAVGWRELPPFVLTAGFSGTAVVAVGQPAVVSLLAAPVADPPQDITFSSVSGLPAGVSYSFVHAHCTAPCYAVLITSPIAAAGTSSLVIGARTAQGRLQTTGLKLSAVTNLVVNPGFEVASNGVPESWSVSPQNVSISTTNPHWGRNCIQIAVGSDSTLQPQISQTVDVTPGTAYRISFWTRQSSDATNNGGYVVQFDSNGTVVLDGNGHTQTALKRLSSTPADTWVMATADLTTSGSTAKLMFYANIYLGTGTTWIDDVTVLPIPVSGD